MLPFMEGFLEWTADYIRHRESMRVEGWSDVEFDQRLHFACEAALLCNLETPLVRLRYVLLVFELGPPLARSALAAACLRGTGPDTLRFDRLLRENELLTKLRECPVAERWADFHPRDDLPHHD